MKWVRLTKKLISNVIFRFSGQKRKIGYYRKQGVKIGKELRLTGVPDFGSEPYLITIGDNVTVTQNVVFHTHDGGVGLFRKEYPGINVFGKIILGNNVFIGSNVIIMPGVTVGNNVVIGAGSIVTKDIPSDSVAVGSPAKVLKSLEEYKESSLKAAVYIKSTDPNDRKKEILEKFNEQN